MGRAKERGGVLLLVGVGLPFPSPTRKSEGGRKDRERERERGAAPPPLVQFGLPWEEARHLLGCCPLSPLRPTKAQYFPGGFR